MEQSNKRVTFNENSMQKITKFRRILPQVIATTIENVHQTDIGFSSAIPGLIIAALTIPNEHNQNESLSLTAVQTSWLGSIGYLALPLGTLVSGYFSDHLGRKRLSILANIPFAIGWFILYQATEVWHIFVGRMLVALVSGLAKTVNVTYVSEICEPSVREMLIGYFNVSGSIGIFLSWILNTLMPWRSVAFVGFMIPVFSTIALCFVPETPQWLLSKNRKEEAEKSLCWLRGWVSPLTIVQEFDELQRHSERSQLCKPCVKQDLPCPHPPPNFAEKLAELKRKRTLKSFTILIPLFFLAQFTGMLSMQPFSIQIFRAYQSPISPDNAVVIMALIETLAVVTSVVLLRFAGKRRLYLTMGMGIFCSSLVISCYGFIFLPSGQISFDQQRQSFHLENPTFAYIPTICLFLWCFFSNCGFISMGWLLVGELFSFKSRGVAVGISTSINFIFGFFSRKTYYNLEMSLSLPGVSLFFCLITAVGLILMYFILPETVGRSLEDIELHFSDNSKKITDWKIPKDKNERNQDIETVFTVYKIEEKRTIHTHNRNNDPNLDDCEPSGTKL